LTRISPLAVPLLVLVGRESVSSTETDDALLIEAAAAELAMLAAGDAVA
jgi:ATP-dependent Lhr-like helicase